jgi:arsenate reductase
MKAIIYHNPKCSTSRTVLATMRERGVEPTIIEYLKDPPSRATLKDLLNKMGMQPRDILRRSGTPYDELGLDDPKLTDDEIFDAIEKHPILIQRPIVVTDRGVVLCRPKERLDEVLGG